MRLCAKNAPPISLISPHPTTLQTFTNGCAVALVVAQLMGHSKVDTEFDVYMVREDKYDS